ncbi:MAG: hypothetical protein K1X78_03025 [Verrucomicrobiaceae bacterium]|nr:hypothetical protein [Verrucomicrobiaceae bacterium]
MKTQDQDQRPKLYERCSVLPRQTIRKKRLSFSLDILQKQAASPLVCHQVYAAALMGLALMAITPTAPALDLFRVVLLSPLEAPELYPQAWWRFKINNAGDVIGNRGDQAAVWRNGTITLLGMPSTATNSNGFDINDSGVVACQVNNIFFVEENSVAIWTPPGSWRRTTFPSGDRFTVPSAISNNGSCVGSSSVAAGIPGLAFFLAPGAETPIRLSPVSGQLHINCAALGINNNASPWIPGVSFTDVNAPLAVVWKNNTNPEALARFVGTTASGAMAINDGNVSVGYCNVETNNVVSQYAVYWDSTGIHVITSGVANDITNSGVIVGSTIQTYSISSSLAWIKFPFDSTVYSLTALQSNSSLTLNTADGINSNYQIVGRCSSGGYSALPVLVRNVGGSWNTASAWNMGITPKSVHPVRLESSAAITVTGPTTAITVSELTVGNNTRLEVQSTQSISVVGNVFGNGNTVVTSSGMLVVGGQVTSPVTVNGILAGAGTINGNVSVQSNGIVLPGTSPGKLSVNGNLSLASGSIVAFEINGNAPGTQYDQIQTSGTVSLSNAILVLAAGFSPTLGDAFVVFDNTGTSPVNGTFSGMPEGSTFINNGFRFQITYQGNTGNDIVLTVLSALTPIENWRFANFGTAANTGAAADEADFDGDKLSNLVEYGFGTSPTTSNVLSTPLIRSENEITLDYTTSDTAADVTVFVESNIDLGSSWTGDGITYEILSSNSGRTTRRAHIPSSNSEPRRFARVKVTRP